MNKKITKQLLDLNQKIADFQDITSNLCLFENRTPEQLLKCRTITLELVYLLKGFAKIIN